MKQNLKISKLGLMASISFVIFVTAFRMTLPFGDEPDFSVRADALVSDAWPTWTIYSWIPGLLASLVTKSNCVIESSSLSLLSHIDYESCKQDVSQVFLRCILTILIVFPLLTVVIWRGLGEMMLKKTLSIAPIEIKSRLDAVALSLLIPGMIYYLSVLSHEQLTLTISLFVFLFWNNWIIVIALVSLVATIDVGNAAVMACLVVIHQLYVVFIKIFGVRTTLVIGLVLLILIGAGGNDLVPYVGVISILEERSDAIYTSIASAEEDLRSKFPLVLRPVITFMTFFLATPSGVKVIPVYVIAMIGLMIGLFRMRNLLKISDGEDKYINVSALLPSVSGIYTIMLFTFLIPGYANGKYYIFMLPFFVRSFMEVFPSWVMYKFFVICSALIPVGMFFYIL